MTDSEQQELERLQRSERLTRGKLATMCEAVMVRVVELEEAVNEMTGERTDQHRWKVGDVAKKLRSTVMAATDFTSSSTNHG